MWLKNVSNAMFCQKFTLFSTKEGKKKHFRASNSVTPAATSIKCFHIWGLNWRNPSMLCLKITLDCWPELVYNLISVLFSISTKYWKQTEGCTHLFSGTSNQLQLSEASFSCWCTCIINCLCAATHANARVQTGALKLLRFHQQCRSHWHLSLNLKFQKIKL